MTKKKNSEVTKAHEIHKAHINLECEYTKDGKINFTHSDIGGSNQILLTICLVLIKNICIQSKVEYREVLSREIRNDLTRETFDKVFKKEEGEDK